MIDVDNSSLPYLLHSDGSKLVLSLGDNRCTFSNQRDVFKLRPFSFFLPGKSHGEIFCTFSALFDGSVALSKESNLAPEIFLNGSRIPSGMNVDIQSGDSIVLGSVEYSYTVDLNDADVEGEQSRKVQPPQDQFFEIFVTGDLKISFTDNDTGKVIPIDQQLAHCTKGISLFSFHQHEIAEWMKWLGLSIKSNSATIHRKHQLLEWKVGICVDLANVRCLSTLDSDCSFLRSLTVENLVVQKFDVRKEGSGLSPLLQRIFEYSSVVYNLLEDLDVARNHKYEDEPDVGVVNNDPPQPDDILTPVYKMLSWPGHVEEIEPPTKEPEPSPKASSPWRLGKKSEQDLDSVPAENPNFSLVAAVCTALRKLYTVHSFGENSKADTSKWVAKCCAALRPMCISPSTGLPVAFQVRHCALSAAITPYWTSKMCRESDDNLFRIVTATIGCIVLLSIKNTLDTHSDPHSSSSYKKISSNELVTNADDKLSFFQPFACFSSQPSSKIDEKTASEDVFMEDLTTMLRWSLPIIEKC